MLYTIPGGQLIDVYAEDYKRETAVGKIGDGRDIEVRFHHLYPLPVTEPFTRLMMLEKQAD
jgi:hypothetical protein